MPRTELGLLAGLGGRGKRLTTFNNPSFFGAFLARLVRFLCAQFLAIMQITAFCLLTNLLFVALSLSLSLTPSIPLSPLHTHILPIPFACVCLPLFAIVLFILQFLFIFLFYCLSTAISRNMPPGLSRNEIK